MTMYLGDPQQDQKKNTVLWTLYKGFKCFYVDAEVSVRAHECVRVCGYDYPLLAFNEL